MKKFSLKSLISKFFLFKEQKDDWEDDNERKPPGIRRFIPKEVPGKDYTLNQMQIGKELKKDVSISSFIVKGPRPWVLEYIIEFYFQPTKEFISKYIEVEAITASDGKEYYKKKGLDIYNFMHDVGRRFGRKAVYAEVDKLKRKVDSQFKVYPILRWSDPAVAYLHSVSFRDRFKTGTGYMKSFKTMEGRNLRLGYYLRFDLPKEINDEVEANKRVSYKAEELKKELLDLKTFNSDENFKLKP